MKRDWKKYNKQLVKRGEITIDEDIFLSENALPSKIQKVGRPKTYSDSLILFALMLKFMLSTRVLLQNFCKLVFPCYPEVKGRRISFLIFFDLKRKIKNSLPATGNDVDFCKRSQNFKHT